MQVTKIKVGPLECNCYILKKDDYAIIIDPGDDQDKIKNEIKDITVKAVLITHNHFDHVGALDMFDKSLVKDCKSLTEGKYEIGNFKFEVIETKGHTDDSITYYFYDDDLMFTGDFLFKETIGRCDFPNSNNDDMINSLNKIKNYNNDIKIYPGHGEESILGLEKRNFDYYINFLKY